MMQLIGCALFFVMANITIWWLEHQYKIACREWRMAYRQDKKGY